jgi:signal transduction histidine kinase
MADGAARVFAWMMAVLSIWAFGYGVELTQSELEAMLFWVRIEYIGVGLLPGLWLTFCLVYAGHNDKVTPLNLALIFLLPVITILMVWTSPWHNLHYQNIGVSTSGPIPLFIFDRGPWYIVHLVYFYILIVVGIALLLRNFNRAAPILRKQTLIVLSGAIGPWLANLFYQLGFSPLDIIDPTPFVFTLTGLVIGVGLLQFKLFNLVPVARDKVIEDLEDGVMVLDALSRIAYVNPAMRSKMKHLDIDLVAHPFDDIFGQYELLCSMVSKRVTSRVQIEINQESGPHTFLEVSGTTLYGKDANYNGMILLFHDISAQKRTEDAINAARERAEESDRLKTAFLANMSHEIRNPLNGIIGFAGILKEGETTEAERTQYLNIIENNAQQLLFIINDIIDISKIESGQERVKPEIILVSDVLKSVQNTYSVLARTKKLDLEIVTSLTANDDRIISDPVKLRQILVNMVGNALKYTIKGTVTLRVEKNEDDLDFFVIDTGVGIKSEHHEMIFERFRQVDSKGSMQVTGTGLGLAISRGYARLLGGEISVESKPGKGSTFLLKIPHIVVDQEKRIKAVSNMNPNQIQPPDWSGKKLLLAEDEPVNVMYMKMALKKTNVELIIAENGAEAIRLFKENTDVKLILMDIKMPEVDGFEASEEIRKLNPNVPIIALSGHAMVEKERLDRAGFSELISKPVRKDDLIAGIDPYMK